jgi:hypothetical protein
VSQMNFDRIKEVHALSMSYAYSAFLSNRFEPVPWHIDGTRHVPFCLHI